MLFSVNKKYLLKDVQIGKTLLTRRFVIGATHTQLVGVGEVFAAQPKAIPILQSVRKRLKIGITRLCNKIYVTHHNLDIDQAPKIVTYLSKNTPVGLRSHNVQLGHAETVYESRMKYATRVRQQLGAMTRPIAMALVTTLDRLQAVAMVFVVRTKIAPSVQTIVPDPHQAAVPTRSMSAPSAHKTSQSPKATRPASLIQSTVRVIKVLPYRSLESLVPLIAVSRATSTQIQATTIGAV